MPRKAREKSSRFGQVQKQAQQLLANLRKEIRAKEDELRRLKTEDSKLSGFAGLTATSVSGATVSRAIGGGRARINWGRVLEQLPKQFRAGDIRKVGGIRDKRPSEIFAAITRWLEAKSVKRKERGLYERVDHSQPRKSKKPA
jgi:hypothetical protein